MLFRSVCGHIHAPNILDMDGISYCNTGDWVEHCSALIEYNTGEMEIVFFEQEQAEVQKSRLKTQPEEKPLVSADFEAPILPSFRKRVLNRLHPLRLIRR